MPSSSTLCSTSERNFESFNVHAHSHFAEHLVAFVHHPNRQPSILCSTQNSASALVEVGAALEPAQCDVRADAEGHIVPVGNAVGYVFWKRVSSFITDATDAMLTCN